MKITFDPVKREKTLKERGLDFADAPEVFNGTDQFTYEDDRFDYGEQRFVTVGFFNHRMVIVVWTQRDVARHIISMRKANKREEKEFKKYMD